MLHTCRRNYLAENLIRSLSMITHSSHYLRNMCLISSMTCMSHLLPNILPASHTRHLFFQHCNITLFHVPTLHYHPLVCHLLFYLLPTTVSIDHINLGMIEIRVLQLTPLSILSPSCFKYSCAFSTDPLHLPLQYGGIAWRGGSRPAAALGGHSVQRRK